MSDSAGETGDFLGIVIGQSLEERAAGVLSLEVRRRIGNWDFLLVRIPSDRIDEHTRELQARMRSDEPWYAHYFRRDELLVVFKDLVVHCGIDSATWQRAIDHGSSLGIPREQLDFKPRTVADALRFFGLAD